MVKFFIDNINTFTGLSLLEELRNDHIEEDNPHEFYATLDPNDATEVESGVVKILSKQKPRSLRRHILDCDVIIYDLHTADLEDVEEKVRLLRDSKLETIKIFILISNVMVWGDTPPKKELQANPEAPVDESAPDIPFDEDDILLRKALPRYQGWKVLENIVLSAGMSKENLETYVVCSGVLYGNGEHLLEYHFRSAWLGDPEQIPYIDNGQNWVPMIHVQDLAKVVKYVQVQKPDFHYLFAVDQSKDSTQLSIINAISQNIGTGQTKSITYEAAALTEWAEALSLNVFIKSSSVEIIKNSDLEYMDDWEAIDGFCESIQKLNADFNLYRGLKPIKVFITGPPAVGKTHMAEKLCKEYNLLHINAQKLSHEILQSDNELGAIVRKRLEEVKEEMIEEAERTKKKNQELDYSKFVPRIPDDLFAEVFRWKLNSNQARNRGFVLEGWPKNYSTAKKLYLISQPDLRTEQDIENGVQEPPKLLNSDIFPDHIIMLKSPNDFLTQRVKQLPETVTHGTHFTDEGMKRRLAAYRDANTNDKGNLGVHDFFLQNNGIIHDIDANTMDENTILENMIQYIERDGRYFNYVISDGQQEEGQEEEIELSPESQVEDALVEEKRSTLEPEGRKDREMDQLLKLEQMKMRERELLETRSQPLRHYLMEHVVPVLSDALMEISKTLPEDPLEFLADFILKASQERNEQQQEKIAKESERPQVVLSPPPEF